MVYNSFAMVEAYLLFGITMVSDFPFTNRLEKTAWQNGNTPDLTFTCVRQPLIMDDPPGPLLYRSLDRNKIGQSALALYRLDDCDLIRLNGVADFYIWPQQIECHVHESGQLYQVEIGLLGTVLTYWLELRGVLALHAAAVVLNDRAVVFLSENKGGKSSLAATCMQAGGRLLTDDVLAVAETREGFLACPGYPVMRMWPDGAQFFTGGYKNLELAHPKLEKRRVVIGPQGFGHFCAEARPLASIYIPERCSTAEGGLEISILPVSPREAVMALLGCSFAAGLVEAAGLAVRRLDSLARLLNSTTVHRLRYPNGYQYLSAVCNAVLADQAGGSNRR